MIEIPATLCPSPELARTIDALRGIGLQVDIVEGAKGFLPGVAIVHGTLQVSPECRLSDLIHEASHLAIVPGRYRHLAHGNLYALYPAMFNDVDQAQVAPDAPLARAILQCTDTEATAWSWAFGMHLGLAPELIIEDGQYPDENGIGTGAEIRMMLSLNRYMGINGLANAGFCSVHRFGKLPVYPQLAFWLQEA